MWRELVDYGVYPDLIIETCRDMLHIRNRMYYARRISDTQRTIRGRSLYGEFEIKKYHPNEQMIPQGEELSISSEVNNTMNLDTLPSTRILQLSNVTLDGVLSIHCHNIVNLTLDNVSNITITSTMNNLRELSITNCSEWSNEFLRYMPNLYKYETDDVNFPSNVRIPSTVHFLTYDNVDVNVADLLGVKKLRVNECTISNYFPSSLESLNCAMCDFEEDNPFAKCTNLRELHIEDSGILRANMIMQNVRLTTIINIQCPNFNIMELPSVSDILYLRTDYTLTDEQLSQFRSLRTLHYYGDNLTGRCFHHMPNLTTLYLESDKHLTPRNMASLTNLWNITLRDCENHRNFAFLNSIRRMGKISSDLPDIIRYLGRLVSVEYLVINDICPGHRSLLRLLANIQHIGTLKLKDCDLSNVHYLGYLHVDRLVLSSTIITSEALQSLTHVREVIFRFGNVKYVPSHIKWRIQ
jgi:hypothetical protein